MVYRSPRHSRRGVTIDLNAVPMIDVIFMLVVFFVLVGRLAHEQSVPMKLPQPHDSKAMPESAADRLVLNCRPSNDADPRDGALYSLGPNPPQPLTEIARSLATLKAEKARAGGTLNVVIRADRRLRLADVRPAMQTVASMDIPMLNVAVQAEEGGS